MLASWLLVFSLIGYPLIGLIASNMGLDAETSSIPYRAVVVALAMTVIVLSLFKPLQFKPMFWLMAFWAAYSIRLGWDAITGVPGVGMAALFVVISRK